MQLRGLKSALRLQPSLSPRFILPDGEQIPAHFHITEVGHVARRFIDCGGTLHDTTETCLLQTYVADDLHHRLDAGTFVRILELGEQVLPNDELEVEVEYDCCVVAQYPLVSARAAGEQIELHLGEKHTDCLAKEKCGIDGEKCGRGAPEEAGMSAACC